VLSSLDDKIDLLHRQNKTLEAMAETLFRQWFVLRQPFDKLSVPAQQPEADDGWEEGRIPDEFDFVMGASPPGISYNEEGIGIPMYQGNADFEFRFPKRRVFTTDPKRFAEKYDTLISVRAPVGEQNMANEKCCIGRGVAAFRYKNDNSFYTYTYFKMKSIMQEIKQFNETGTVFGSISKGDFANIEIIIPPKDLVDEFQSRVKPIDDKIIANCFQIRTLEKLRDTLLPKLMSGEIRLNLD
jgi:type I restriction enzyme S subunit